MFRTNSTRCRRSGDFILCYFSFGDLFFIWIICNQVRFVIEIDPFGDPIIYDTIKNKKSLKTIVAFEVKVWLIEHLKVLNSTIFIISSVILLIR